MSTYGKIIRNLLGLMKPPGFDIGNSSFRKRTMKRWGGKYSENL